MDIIALLLENLAVSWLVVGFLLLAGEMVVPGVYLLWLGLAGLITGAISFAIPDNFINQVVLFSLLSAGLVYFANRSNYTTQPESPTEGAVNRRGHQHVGRIYEVLEGGIKNGRGRVKVGDSQWAAEGPDCEAGTLVEVIDMDGSLMRVALVADEKAVKTA